MWPLSHSPTVTQYPGSHTDCIWLVAIVNLGGNITKEGHSQGGKYKVGKEWGIFLEVEISYNRKKMGILSKMGNFSRMGNFSNGAKMGICLGKKNVGIFLYPRDIIWSWQQWDIWS